MNRKAHALVFRAHILVTSGLVKIACRTTCMHEWDGVQVPPVLASGESAGDFTLIGQTFVGSRIAAEKRSFTVTGSMNNLDIEQECVNSFPSHKSFFHDFNSVCCVCC